MNTEPCVLFQTACRHSVIRSFQQRREECDKLSMSLSWADIRFAGRFARHTGVRWRRKNSARSSRACRRCMFRDLGPLCLRESRGRPRTKQCAGRNNLGPFSRKKSAQKWASKNGFKFAETRVYGRAVQTGKASSTITTRGRRLPREQGFIRKTWPASLIRKISHSKCTADNTVCRSAIKASRDPTISQVTHGLRAYGGFFPKSQINLYRGVMGTNWVLPLGPDHAVVFDFYFTDRGKQSTRSDSRDSIAVAQSGSKIGGYGVSKKCSAAEKVVRTTRAGRVKKRGGRGY